MTPIERAARLLVMRRGGDPDAWEPGNTPYSDDTEIVDHPDFNGGPAFYRWRLEVPVVRAVLQAIREPSEGMVEAGALAYSNTTGVVARTSVTWTAMIDAALSE